MAPLGDDKAVAVTDKTDLPNGNENSKQGLITTPTLSSAFDDAPGDEDFDLICVGFGPASLAIAIALHDATSHSQKGYSGFYVPKVCFLEKQLSFRWHAGMLLPGSKMQISFLKDLATLRDPTSKFTFLNYLKSKNRLVQFTNLSTFLPTRMEFEDYLRWCADHFSDCVNYGQEVRRIKPIRSIQHKSKVDLFAVESHDLVSGKKVSRRARHVVIAIGGRPTLPAPFHQLHSRVIHSSSYCSDIPRILPSRQAPYTIAVVGSGQSAAEIFNDLPTRYPNSRTTLAIKDIALRPSDDSPFVNEIFNPERVDEFYLRPEAQRAESLESNRSTNYGVVRLQLLEEIYNILYQQRVREPDEQAWQHRILPSRKVTEVQDSPAGLRLTLEKVHSVKNEEPEFLEVDAVIVATGYSRDAHEDMLKELEHLKPNKPGEWHVRRNYKIDFNNELVDQDAGIWLQGANESSHGISDTLLSILATRSGEIVDSIFGSRLKRNCEMNRGLGYKS